MSKHDISSCCFNILRRIRANTSVHRDYDSSEVAPLDPAAKSSGAHRKERKEMDELHHYHRERRRRSRETHVGSMETTQRLVSGDERFNGNGSCMEPVEEEEMMMDSEEVKRDVVPPEHDKDMMILVERSSPTADEGVFEGKKGATTYNYGEMGGEDTDNHCKEQALSSPTLPSDSSTVHQRDTAVLPNSSSACSTSRHNTRRSRRSVSEQEVERFLVPMRSPDLSSRHLYESRQTVHDGKEAAAVTRGGLRQSRSRAQQAAGESSARTTYSAPTGLASVASRHKPRNSQGRFVGISREGTRKR